MGLAGAHKRNLTRLTLRRFHRLNALVLGTFIVLHLVNHAFTLAGVDAIDLPDVYHAYLREMYGL